MIKRQLLLNGLAILAVVSNHAASWGYVGMFWWVDRYSDLTPPSFAAVGSFSYYVLAVFRHLTVFSVPAFLFVSGFFIAYAAKGSQSTLSWKVVRVRIGSLLAPYLLWSLATFAAEIILGNGVRPLAYLYRLLTGGAIGAYFFIPLLIQFYLLSPWMVSLAKKRPGLLILLAILVRLLTHLVDYDRLIGLGLPFTIEVPAWFFGRFALFFPLGIVAGFHLQQVQAWLGRIKPVLVIAGPVLIAAVLIEQEVLYRVSSLVYGGTFLSLSSTLYSLWAIFAFLSLKQLPARVSAMLNNLGNKTFGIFLVHPLIQEYMSRAVYHFAPGMLAYPLVGFVIMVVAGAGIPWLMMNIMSKSAVRQSYRYVFG